MNSSDNWTFFGLTIGLPIVLVALPALLIANCVATENHETTTRMTVCVQAGGEWISGECRRGK